MRSLPVVPAIAELSQGNDELYTMQCEAEGLIMDLKQAIYTRRAVREFASEPIDEKDDSPADRRGHPGAECRQRTSMVIFGRARQGCAPPNLRPGQSIHT